MTKNNKPEMTIDEDDSKFWHLDGKLHREDGPAIERCDDSKEWYANGKRHRIDGPAVVHFEGTKEWYINGNLHREDGPAIEWSDGTKEFWLFGEKFEDEEVFKTSASILNLIWMKHENGSKIGYR